MAVARRPGGVRRRVRGWKAAGDRVAFVPTMGFFHEGHLSLMRWARAHADRVVVSLFVNPTQFAPHEDLSRYPRDLPRDLRLARAEGVDLCFVPDAGTLYGPGHRTEIHVTGLDSVLEGRTRPTHFAGVALVVLKLLHIVEPDLLVLGRKDAQQAVILSRMVADLDLDVRVVLRPTVRERDGVAMSSRNSYLSPPERQAARVLSRALALARAAVRDGERSARAVRALVEREIRHEPRARLDYAAVVDAETLDPVTRLRGRVLVPVAAWIGPTRLIDNAEIVVGDGS
jgi:pantoate--beta-alanine ligase